MTEQLRWPSVIAVSALALDLLVLANAPIPVRVLVALWFFLICTGMSFVPLLEVGPVRTQLLLGVLVSIVLDTLATTAIVEIGGLSASSGLVVLQSICLLGCGLQVRSWRRDVRSLG